MTTVVVADTWPGLGRALDEVFAACGGVRAALPDRGGTLYVKPNGIHFAPYTHTDPQVLDALLGYLRDHGYRRLAVLENCTAGNFTRLVFRATGYDRICRRHGARAVYLDEEPLVTMALEAEPGWVRVPRTVRDEIVERGANTYLTLPKLKTHSMTTVTLGVKSQQAFPCHADRMHMHSADTLHRRLAALYRLVRPDFCLIEGVTATAHGHFPATALLGESLRRLDVLVGGPDTLAVDAVGARILGYRVDEIEHLRLAAAWGLGEADLDRIEVRGVPLARFTERLPATLLGRFQAGVRILEGRERACVEGCKGNSECILQMLACDHGGRGGWTLAFGRGFRPQDLEDLPGDILLVGPCAVAELEDELRARYPRRRVHAVRAHNDIMENARHQARLAGVSPLRMVPLGAIEAGLALATARLRGLTARVLPLAG